MLACQCHCFSRVFCLILVVATKAEVRLKVEEADWLSTEVKQSLVEQVGFFLFFYFVFRLRSQICLCLVMRNGTVEVEERDFPSLEKLLADFVSCLQIL